jgi:GNAT superfamily N-acetyltransferase
MKSAEDIAIRKYNAADEQQLKALCCDTAYFGEPCEAFFNDRELLADLVMKYYTDYEPEHLWIAQHQQEIVGYICGYFDESAYNKVMFSKIALPSLMRALIRGKLWHRKTSRMIGYMLKSLFSQEGKLKSLDCRKFPVHIHQNVKNGFRGRGIGRKLLMVLLEEVSKAGLCGIKFRALRLEPCFPFFEKYGFNKFDCRRVKNWEAWLGKAPLYFMEYGKSL